MKKVKLLLLILISLVLLVFMIKDQLVIFIAKTQLQKVFVKSEINVEKAALGISSLKIKNVSIKNADFPYELKLKQLAVNFSLPLILKQALSRVEISGLQIKINAGNKTPQDFIKTLILGKGGFSYRRLALLDISADVNFKEITTDLKLTLDISPENNFAVINHLKAQSGLTQISGLQVNFLFCNLANGVENNSFHIGSIVFNKTKLNKIIAQFRLDKEKIACDNFEFDLFGGKVMGNAFADLKELTYELNGKAAGIDLAKISQDFELQNKVEMTGLFDGLIEADGKAAKIYNLSGKLMAHAEGGKFIIKDPAMLTALKSTGNESIEITLDALKDFTYAIGDILLSKKKQDVILDLQLKGDKGNIRIPLTLHDALP